MTSNITPQERRNRRRTGLLAGVAGGVLLIGGSTFALWSDSDTQAGGTITNGNLDVAAAGSIAYFDTSANRTDATSTNPITATAAHTIASIASYTIVPGDTLEANYPFSVALDGDNLVANIKASLPSGTAATGVTFTAQAYYLNGTTWTAVGTPVALTAGSGSSDLGNFQAANQADGTLDGTLPVISASTTGATPNVTVVVRAAFASGTSAQVSAQATSALGNVQVDVTQIRTAGVGNFQ